MDSAHTPPTEQPHGKLSLSFTISGTWGHFRQIDKTTVKLTYRVIPRPTLAGLISGILGLERDSYYSRFDPETTRIAIAPEPMLPNDVQSVETDLQTQPFGQNELTIEESDVHSELGLIDPESTTKHRQQRHREYVRYPAYRVWITSADDELYSALRTALQTRKFVYTPTLGTSDCPATVTYHGEQEITDATGETVVNSTLRISDVNPLCEKDAVDSSCSTERTPYHMASHENGGRVTTGFIQYAYSSEKPIACAEGVELSSIGQCTVQFQ